MSYEKFPLTIEHITNHCPNKHQLVTICRQYDTKNINFNFLTTYYSVLQQTVAYANYNNYVSLYIYSSNHIAYKHNT